MKQQNQISEVAKKARIEVEKYFWQTEVNGKMTLLCNPEAVERIIQQSIDAATAEVKKEGSLGSETPATMGVQREETGNPQIATREAKQQELHREIKSAINRCSVEGWSNTPDSILAQFIIDCLNAFDAATGRRERWYGYAMHPIDGPVRLHKLGSEVPTQKAPTDSRKNKGNAPCLAAPSRKQEERWPDGVSVCGDCDGKGWVEL